MDRPSFITCTASVISALRLVDGVHQQKTAFGTDAYRTDPVLRRQTFAPKTPRNVQGDVTLGDEAGDLDGRTGVDGFGEGEGQNVGQHWN